MTERDEMDMLADAFLDAWQDNLRAWAVGAVDYIPDVSGLGQSPVSPFSPPSSNAEQEPLDDK